MDSAAADDQLHSASSVASDAPSNGGWQKVTYAKRNRRAPPQAPGAGATGGPHAASNGGAHVFDSVEQKAYDRRRAIEVAQAEYAAREAAAAGPTARSDEDSDDEAMENGGADAAAAPKKIKEKKPKKPKVTVAEAAAKINADDLAAHLLDVSGSYESQQDIQLMRFTDYFGKAFAAVSSAQFPWAKLFKESPVSKIIEIPLCHISDSVYKTSADWISQKSIGALGNFIPLCHISDSVYKTSADWISQKSIEALGNFVLWCLDSILADLVNQQPAGKGSKKPIQQPSSKSQVAIFVVLAMTLRRKPDVLINLLLKLKDNPKYHGHEKFPLIVWVVGQASQGDIVTGMYACVHYLLPLISGKPNVNPQSRDLTLQLVERILSGPKARSILLNGAVRKGERLVPPSALDVLMRATFPAQSARVKATERFEAIYPTLKELALAGSPGTKTTKQASQQLLPSTVKAMQENNPELTKDAADVFIWCLVQNPDCYKQWEKLHLDNVDASVAVLRKLSEEWKDYSAKFSPPDALRLTLKNLRAENEQALSGAADSSKHASIKEADKHCKAILGRISRRSGCVKGGLVVIVAAFAIGFAVSPNMESWDLKKLQAMVSSSLQSF